MRSSFTLRLAIVAAALAVGGAASAAVLVDGRSASVQGPEYTSPAHSREPAGRGPASAAAPIVASSGATNMRKSATRVTVAGVE